MELPRRYDVIVIGGGHAGTEAARAAASVLSRANAARTGRVALVTMDPSKIGTMSCNPAIGGLAKGQIVREIDALGGLMALATDATGIQFRVLNMSKGPAVRGPRAQCDKYAYRAEVQRLIASIGNLDVIAGAVDDLIVENDQIRGVLLPGGAGVVQPVHEPVHLTGAPAVPIFPDAPAPRDRIDQPVVLHADAVVLTTGTFMRGLMHSGESKTKGGRAGEGAADGISGMLRHLGFELGRLKTGTPPRLDAQTIDFDQLEAQHGDASPTPFSDLTPIESHGRFPLLRQATCHATRTDRAAHRVIEANLHRAPMYSGAIDAESGPRYCPSIEDKVVRFADRDAHHVFLEPESLHTNEIYCNGISTSLPRDVQEVIVRTMSGCARATILRLGYAVEYDMVRPHQIDATTMTKRVEGLFLAGQINGTSGYEEAGGQGLLAGLNAARRATGDDCVRLGRDEAFIGVMLDDLVTKTPREPYRMFTSRAEYRLMLRADNADARLTPLARSWGLIEDDRWETYTKRASTISAIHDRLSSARHEGKRLRDLAKRPDATPTSIRDLLGDDTLDLRLLERAIIDIQYEGYIVRQQAEIKRQRKAENQAIPDDIDFRSIKGLRSEAAEALDRFSPATMGQAGRLAGVNPADLTILAVAIERFHESRSNEPVVSSR